MFKIGEKVFFLIEQRNNDITLEEGELISHDEETVCMITYVGGDNNKIRFISKDYVFDNVKDGMDAYEKCHKEILEAKKKIKRMHISMFDPKD